MQEEKGRMTPSDSLHVSQDIASATKNHSGRCTFACLPIVCLAAFFLSVGAFGSAQSKSAQQLVQEVVNNELYANRNDHSRWMYRDADKTPTKDVVNIVVQTSQGSVSKAIEINGLPPNAQQEQQDHEHMESIVNDPSVRAKRQKSSAHDDQQAVSLMKMLPNAFLWTEGGESNGEVTLHFKPNPAFQPPTYASRVFAAMAGEMVVDPKQKRLKVLSGTLIQPVEFGWGLLGKLEQGGTFRVIHAEVAPGDWEITQTHVHILGHALIFKSISEQEDEVSTNYKPSPASITLSEAAQMLTDGTAEKDIGLSPEK